MTELALQVTNLHKKIRKREIIKGISFEVMPGEVFGFLGPNGAGKTTTIRMIVGLIKPTSGTILIGEKIYGKISPKQCADLARSLKTQNSIHF